MSLIHDGGPKKTGGGDDIAKPSTITIDPEAEVSADAYLAGQLSHFRRAGNKLAEAALRVVRESDGVHRLALAVSEWAKAVADEGGRGGQPIIPEAIDPETLREVRELLDGAREHAEWIRTKATSKATPSDVPANRPRALPFQRIQAQSDFVIRDIDAALAKLPDVPEEPRAELSIAFGDPSHEDYGPIHEWESPDVPEEESHHSCGAQGFDPMKGDRCLGCDERKRVRDA